MSPLRPCLDCKKPTAGSRCPSCRSAQDRARDAARGTTTERGYGSDHQALRAHYQQRMDAGEQFTCWRPGCGDPIDPTRWHLGHDDHDRTLHRGPECVDCNLSAAGRASRRPA